MFFNVYFGNYVKYKTSRFHKDVFAITEDPTIKLSVIVAWRGSGKSTLMTLSYPLWSILGEQEKKFVLILSQTQRQSRQHLINLKHELESNKLLQADLGPFKEETDEWGSLSLVIPKYNARITAASTEQSVRGLRHLEHRPDLIICDDIEDLESVKTKEGRDKTHQWLTGDVIPSGDKETRVIVVGNLLHEDSVLMRLKKGIVDEKKLDGVFRYYPLVDETGVIAWPGKYPNMQAIEDLKRTIGNDSAWYREYLLRIISDSERVVHPEWIHHYDVLPKSRSRFHYAATGIDLAISQRTTADFTAMVSGFFYMGDKERKIIYILPNPVNARLTFPEALDKAKWVSKTIDPGHTSKLFVEEVAYQKAFTQQLAEDGFHVEGIKVGNQDKRSRLALTTNMIKNGQILFPEKGCEQLIAQLTGFGVEKHDDLVDAFTILVLKITEENIVVPEVFCISMGPRLGRRGLSDDNYWSRYMD